MKIDISPDMQAFNFFVETADRMLPGMDTADVQTLVLRLCSQGLLATADMLGEAHKRIQPEASKPAQPCENLALVFARKGGRTVEACRKLYSNDSRTFAMDMQSAYGGDLVSIRVPLLKTRWHFANEIAGLVHDLWLDEPEPVKQWVIRHGGREWCRLGE